MFFLHILKLQAMQQTTLTPTRFPNWRVGRRTVNVQPHLALRLYVGIEHSQFQLHLNFIIAAFGVF